MGRAARYHSLYTRVGAGFEVIAASGEVAAIENMAAGRWAVRFHPESILTAAEPHRPLGDRKRAAPDRQAVLS